MKRRMVLIITVLMVLASALPSVASLAWGNCSQFYTVRPGDTLASIALRYGTGWPYLASINNLPNPNFIFWGETLCVRGTYGTTPPPSHRTTYVVQRGDYLALIARRFGVSLFSLLQANPRMNPNLIFPGEVLIIPRGGYVTPYSQSYVPPASVQSNPPSSPSSNPQPYVPPSTGGAMNAPLPPNATPDPPN